MWLRNNSKKEWLDYNCGGGEVVDVLPNSDFKVSDKAGALLLRNLGCSAWVQEIPDPRTEPEETPEQTIVIPDEEEKPDAQKEKKPGILDKLLGKRPFCTKCDSKGGRHKKECATNSGDEIDPVGGQEELSGDANQTLEA